MDLGLGFAVRPGLGLPGLGLNTRIRPAQAYVGNPCARPAQPLDIGLDPRPARPGCRFGHSGLKPGRGLAGWPPGKPPYMGLVSAPVWTGTQIRGWPAVFATWGLALEKRPVIRAFSGGWFGLVAHFIYYPFYSSYAEKKQPSSVIVSFNWRRSHLSPVLSAVFLGPPPIRFPSVFSVSLYSSRRRSPLFPAFSLQAFLFCKACV